ncbi:transglycosylase SLT domain-containing protein, partial [Staphylococcus aureus]|nr:transglycosylase SLT domain-containing protein [Staphylococcus aureus]
LMQVMPTTARMIQKVTKSQLLKPEVNVAIGTKYFLKRLNQFGGDVELTLAAYNAGAGRVDQWLKRYPTDNKMLFLDFIPFRETRE